MAPGVLNLHRGWGVLISLNFSSGDNTRCILGRRLSGSQNHCGQAVEEKSLCG